MRKTNKEMINDNRFEELWEKEERRGVELRLQREYPIWKRRRQRTMSAAAAVTLMIMVGVPLLKPATPTGFDKVYCNRTGTTDTQWAALAADILTREVI